MKTSAVFIAILLSFSIAAAQQPKIDSLQRGMEHAEGEERIQFMTRLGHVYIEKQPDKAMDYLSQALKLAKAGNYKTEKAVIYSYLGYYYFMESRLDSAMHFTRKAFAQKQHLKTPQKLHYLYSNLAIIYERRGQLDSSMHYYQKQLKIAKKHNLKRELGAAYSNIAILYNKNNQRKKALQYNHKALDIFKKQKNYRAIGIVLNNIGELNRSMGDLDKALTYYHNSIKNSQKADNTYHNALAAANMALTYSSMEARDSALHYFRKALKIAEKYDYKRLIAQNHSNLASFYAAGENYAEAIAHSRTSLEISQSYNIAYGIAINSLNLAEYMLEEGQTGKIPSLLQESQRIIAEKKFSALKVSLLENYYRYYKALENYAKALHYHEEKTTLQDSIFSAEKNQQIRDLQTKYETRKKEQANKLLKKDNKYQQAVIQKQRYLFAAALLVLLGTVIAWFFVLRGRKRQKLFNRQLAEKNEEIQTQAGALQKNNRMLTEASEFNHAMTRMMVHDLKMPLSLIINFAEKINHSRTREVIQQYSRQMLNLIMNILDVYRHRHASMNIEPKTVDLRKIATNALAEVSLFARERGVGLHNEVPGQLFAEADQILLTRIVVNLLTNGIKYTSQGNNVYLHTQTKREEVTFFVTDEGKGIHSSRLEAIFNDYKRDTSAKSVDNLSTGVGLHFAKIAVEAHHSQLHIHSEINKGTSISFSLKKSTPKYAAENQADIQDKKPQLQQLPHEKFQGLKEPVNKLKTCKSYEITCIRKILKTIERERSGDPVIQTWVEQLYHAASNGNREAFYYLLNPAETAH